jgi:hypothetical protein
VRHNFQTDYGNLFDGVQVVDVRGVNEPFNFLAFRADAKDLIDSRVGGVKETLIRKGLGDFFDKWRDAYEQSPRGFFGLRDECLGFNSINEPLVGPRTELEFDLMIKKAHILSELWKPLMAETSACLNQTGALNDPYIAASRAVCIQNGKETEALDALEQTFGPVIREVPADEVYVPNCPEKILCVLGFVDGIKRYLIRSQFVNLFGFKGPFPTVEGDVHTGVYPYDTDKYTIGKFSRVYVCNSVNYSPKRAEILAAMDARFQESDLNLLKTYCGEYAGEWDDQLIMGRSFGREYILIDRGPFMHSADFTFRPISIEDRDVDDHNHLVITCNLEKSRHSIDLRLADDIMKKKLDEGRKDQDYARLIASLHSCDYKIPCVYYAEPYVVPNDLATGLLGAKRLDSLGVGNGMMMDRSIGDRSIGEVADDVIGSQLHTFVNPVRFNPLVYRGPVAKDNEYVAAVVDHELMYWGIDAATTTTVEDGGTTVVEDKINGFIASLSGDPGDTVLFPVTDFTFFDTNPFFTRKEELDNIPTTMGPILAEMNLRAEAGAALTMLPITDEEMFDMNPFNGLLTGYPDIKIMSPECRRKAVINQAARLPELGRIVAELALFANPSKPGPDVYLPDVQFPNIVVDPYVPKEFETKPYIHRACVNSDGSISDLPADYGEVEAHDGVRVAIAYQTLTAFSRGDSPKGFFVYDGPEYVPAGSLAEVEAYVMAGYGYRMAYEDLGHTVIANSVRIVQVVNYPCYNKSIPIFLIAFRFTFTVPKAVDLVMIEDPSHQWACHPTNGQVMYKNHEGTDALYPAPVVELTVDQNIKPELFEAANMFVPPLVPPGIIHPYPGIAAVGTELFTQPTTTFNDFLLYVGTSK